MATPPIPKTAPPGMPLTQGYPGNPLAPPVQKPLDQTQVLHRLIWAGLFIATLLFISPATVMLLFFGLLPSFVALITDRSDGKYAMFCVLGLNFSGLFPFLADLWFKTDSIDAATNILTDVFSLFIIYGAAGFGVMFYMVVPPVVTSLLSVMSQRRVAELRENQAKIVEEWGEGVTKAAEVVGVGGIAAP